LLCDIMFPLDLYSNRIIILNVKLKIKENYCLSELDVYTWLPTIIAIT